MLIQRLSAKSNLSRWSEGKWRIWMQLLLAHLRTHTTTAHAPSLNTLQFPRARGCVVMMQLKLVSCAWVFNTWLLDCPYFWIFICAGLGPELQSQISRLKAEHSNYTFFCCDFFFFSFLHSATKVGKTYLYIYIWFFFLLMLFWKHFCHSPLVQKIIMMR